MDNPASLTSQEEAIYLVGSATSRPQHSALIAVMTTSCCLSIFGSTSILFMSRNKLGQNSPYYRLLAGLSFADIIFSTMCMLQPWALPRDIMSPSVVTSSFGNAATCSADAFMFFIANSTASSYNALLSVHFVLIVVFNWSNEMIVRRFERFAHVVAWGWPWTIHLPLAIMGGYNPDEFLLLCVPMGYPPNCGEENTCVRGSQTVQVRRVLILFNGIVTSIGIGGAIWVYKSFRSQVRLSTSHNEFSSITTVRGKMLQRVKMRSFLYSMVYFNTIIWIVLVEAVNEHTDLSTSHSDLVYVVKFLAYLFFPLQGFLNMIVFLYPLISAQRQGVTPKPSVIAVFFALLQKSMKDSSNVFQESGSLGDNRETPSSV